MLAYITKRLILLIFVLYGVGTIVFFLIHMIPGDPVDIMLGDSAVAADKDELRKNLGLDKPVLTQYVSYLSGVVRGDLGTSIHSREKVLDEILERVPASFELMCGAMFIAILIAFPLGILSALKPYGFTDTVSMTVSFIGISMPNFWLGPILIIIFAIELDWLPANERGGFFNLILPAITLGTAMAAMLSRMIRSSLLEVLGEDFIKNARARGLSEKKVVLKHAMRNSMIPVITIIGLQVGVLLSGAIITEAIFDWPGLGSLLLDGINERNYPLVQGCILFIASIYVFVNLITDIMYAYADPRVRLQ
ncbi:MAG: ABC transporter permease [Desulfobacterales bacterium]|nr:ABC transporter permease [Desulfobacterales bacterium]